MEVAGTPVAPRTPLAQTDGNQVDGPPGSAGCTPIPGGKRKAAQIKASAFSAHTLSLSIPASHQLSSACAQTPQPAGTPATLSKGGRSHKSVSFAEDQPSLNPRSSDQTTPRSSCARRRPSSPWSARRRMSAGSTPGTKGANSSTTSVSLCTDDEDDNNDLREEAWQDEHPSFRAPQSQYEPEAATIVTGDGRFGGSPDSPKLVSALQSAFDANHSESFNSGIPSVMCSASGESIEGWLFKIGKKDSSPPHRGDAHFTTASEQLEMDQQHRQHEEAANSAWMFATPITRGSSLDFQAGLTSMPSAATVTPSLKAQPQSKASTPASPDATAVPAFAVRTPGPKSKTPKLPISIEAAAASASAEQKRSPSHGRSNGAHTTAVSKRQRKRHRGTIALWQRRAERLREELLAERKAKEDMIALMQSFSKCNSKGRKHRKRSANGI